MSMLIAAGAFSHGDGDLALSELRVAERHLTNAERQLQVRDRGVANLPSLDPDLRPFERR